MSWEDSYRSCELCPRFCRVDRMEGRAGYCGQTAECRVASVGAHHGEEPPISGTRGSGTVFFSGCSCGCFFCQNWQISLGHAGDPIPLDLLVDRLAALAHTGVHNINFVTPDHFWPHVEQVSARLRARGIALPFLANGSGYLTADQAGRQAESMDIFLPDFKYADPALAARYLSDDRYPELALAALQRMIDARGFLDSMDPTGGTPARRGVLIRHLVLPGEVENSLAVVRLLRREFGRHVPISIMSQFGPTERCRARGELIRRVTAAEYQQVVEAVEETGFTQVFVQELGGDDAFTPDFDAHQPFPGNARSPPVGGEK